MRVEVVQINDSRRRTPITDLRDCVNTVYRYMVIISCFEKGRDLQLLNIYGSVNVDLWKGYRRLLFSCLCLTTSTCFYPKGLDVHILQGHFILDQSEVYICMNAFGRRFYPKATCIAFKLCILSIQVFSENSTHDLGVASVMPYCLCLGGAWVGFKS